MMQPVASVVICLVLLAPWHDTSAQQPPHTTTKRILRRKYRIYDDVLSQKPLENTTVSDPTQYLYTVPWLDPKGPSRPYMGLHNDLDTLLRVQASNEGIVTWTFFTNSWRVLLMNFVYSLMRYGKVTSFIVVTLDPVALQTCMSLNLPCFNASATAPTVVGRYNSNEILEFDTPVFMELTKWKPTMSLLILQRGYSVHYADPDCVFVKNAYRSMLRSLELFHADAIAMRELFGDNTINVGHYLARNTPATVRLFETWAADNGLRGGYANEQAYLNSFRGKLWDVCYNGYNCTVHSRAGMVAWQGYVEQGSGWWGEQCLNFHKYWSCADHAVMLHFMCLPGGLPEKIEWMQKYKVWFLDNITTMETWTSFQREGHPWLPCRDELAWRTVGLSLAFGAV